MNRSGNRVLQCGSMLLMLLTATLACKKKKNDNPFGSARLATVAVSHAGSVINYRVVYGTYNNVDSFVLDGAGTSVGYHGFRKFQYFGTSYSISDETGATFDVYANSDGQILKVLNDDSLTMSYNGSQLTVLERHVPSVTPPYYVKSLELFTWKNGDILYDSTGGTPYTYDYNTGQYGQPGDAWRIEAFLALGRSYVKTTHLVSDMMYTSKWIQKYFYQFDASGRISQLLKVVNKSGIGADDSVTMTYTYY